MFIMIDISKLVKIVMNSQIHLLGNMLQQCRAAAWGASKRLYGDESTVPDEDLREACSRMIRFVSNCIGG